MSQLIGQVWREVVGCNWPVIRVPQFIALRKKVSYGWRSKRDAVPIPMQTGKMEFINGKIVERIHLPFLYFQKSVI